MKQVAADPNLEAYREKGKANERGCQRTPEPRNLTPQRRAAARAARGAGAGVQGAIRNCRAGKSCRRFPPMAIISADEVESIHQASLKVLEEIGMDFHAAGSPRSAAEGGRRVSRASACALIRAMVEELMASAPSQISPSMPAIPRTTAQIGGPIHAVWHRRQPAQLRRHGRRPPHRQPWRTTATS